MKFEWGTLTTDGSVHGSYGRVAMRYTPKLVERSNYWHVEQTPFAFEWRAWLVLCEDEGQLLFQLEGTVEVTETVAAATGLCRRHCEEAAERILAMRKTLCQEKPP